MPEFDAGHTLGVGLGSSTTVAAARTPDGLMRILPCCAHPGTPTSRRCSRRSAPGWGRRGEQLSTAGSARFTLARGAMEAELTR